MNIVAMKRIQREIAELQQGLRSKKSKEQRLTTKPNTTNQTNPNNEILIDRNEGGDKLERKWGPVERREVGVFAGGLSSGVLLTSVVWLIYLRMSKAKIKQTTEKQEQSDIVIEGQKGEQTNNKEIEEKTKRKPIWDTLSISKENESIVGAQPSKIRKEDHEEPGWKGQIKIGSFEISYNPSKPTEQEPNELTSSQIISKNTIAPALELKQESFRIPAAKPLAHTKKDQETQCDNEKLEQNKFELSFEPTNPKNKKPETLTSSLINPENTMPKTLEVEYQDFTILNDKTMKPQTKTDKTQWGKDELIKRPEISFRTHNPTTKKHGDLTSSQTIPYQTMPPGLGLTKDKFDILIKKPLANTKKDQGTQCDNEKLEKNKFELSFEPPTKTKELTSSLIIPQYNNWKDLEITNGEVTTVEGEPWEPGDEFLAVNYEIGPRREKLKEIARNNVVVLQKAIKDTNGKLTATSDKVNGCVINFRGKQYILSTQPLKIDEKTKKEEYDTRKYNSLIIKTDRGHKLDLDNGSVLCDDKQRGIIIAQMESFRLPQKAYTGTDVVDYGTPLYVVYTDLIFTQSLVPCTATREAMNPSEAHLYTPTQHECKVPLSYVLNKDWLGAAVFNRKCGLVGIVTTTSELGDGSTYMTPISEYFKVLENKLDGKKFFGLF